jgi:hypothetical protein
MWCLALNMQLGTRQNSGGQLPVDVAHTIKRRLGLFKSSVLISTVSKSQYRSSNMGNINATSYRRGVVNQHTGMTAYQKGIRVCK